MTTETVQPDPRFPIGRFVRPLPGDVHAGSLLSTAIENIAQLPEQLRNALKGLDHGQLDTPYREGGWTVRQLIHHIADSHMNAFCRVRLALTAEMPTISAYNEKAWAELHDSVAAPVEWSLELIESLHARWGMLLQSLTEEQWHRSFVHPEHGAQTIEFATLLYGWHSRHHLAHITHLRVDKGW